VCLLQSFPTLQEKLPILQAGAVTALRQRLAVQDSAGLTMPAIVDIRWVYAGSAMSLVGRCVNRHIILHGSLHPDHRGLFNIPVLQMSTSAPLGLFVLGCVRENPFDLIILPAASPWVPAAGGLSDSGDPETGGVQPGEGDQWYDLRAYVPGDALARVHWRKADGDIRNWVVKRFTSIAQAESRTLLRVDLRMPTGMDESAFEQLLGRACSWVQQHEYAAATLILGQDEFDLSRQDQYRQALKALAAAQPEPEPPAGQGGLLLSLRGGRC